MKRHLILIAMVLVSLGVFAQNLSYQTVVRNSNHDLMANETMTVQVHILTTAHAPQYVETHNNVQSNKNGLISLNIGAGTVVSGTFADIKWGGANIMLKIKLSNGTVIDKPALPITAVAHALYADRANVSYEDVYNIIHNLSDQQFSDVFDDLLKDYLSDNHYVVNSNPACADSLDICAINNISNHFGDTLKKYLTNENYFVNYIGDSISQFITQNNIFTANVKDSIANFLAANHYVTNTNTACADVIDACNLNNIFNHFGDTLKKYLTNENYFVNYIGDSISQFITQNNIFTANVKDSIANFLAANHYVTNTNTACQDVIDVCDINNTVNHFGDTLKRYLNNESYFVTNVGDEISQYVSQNNIFTANLKDSIANFLAANHYVTNTNTACADEIDACLVGTPVNFRDSLANYLAENHYVQNSNTTCNDEIDACIVSNNVNFRDSLANYLAANHYVRNSNRSSSDTINTYLVTNFADTVGGYLSANHYIVNSGENCSDSVDVCGILSEPVVETQLCGSSGVGGEVIRNGGMPVTKRGLCWSVEPHPVYTDSHTEDGSGDGRFTTTITGLEPNMTYYVRAYAVNSIGVGYGSIEKIRTPFSTDGTSCGTATDHEGNTYNTVRIGAQCWTKENMRCTTSPKGYLEPDQGLVDHKRAFYKDNSAFVTSDYPLEKIGHLYSWRGAMDTATSADPGYCMAQFVNRRGICPEGWHVPSIDEWKVFINYLTSVNEYSCDCNDASVGIALAEKKQGWGDRSGCAVGAGSTEYNKTGFSFVPVASDMTEQYSFYSSTSATHETQSYWAGTHAYGFTLYVNSGYIDTKVGNGAGDTGLHKNYYAAVRCVKDN